MSKIRYAATHKELEQGYEENTIGLKGILYFGIGLLLLIIVTFALMWAFLGTLHDYATANQGPANPLALNEKDRLPPEPRLQAAPGFGVESNDGRVNLELMAPQSEYRELHKQWLEQWKDGEIDPKTGTVISMSIEEAKEKFLESSAKARSGADADKTFKESKMFVSDAGAGRRASEMRR